MNGVDPAKMKQELTETLVKTGVSREEAEEMAARQIDSMGVVKIYTGNCPINAFSPMACMFCEFGHMTECHYPQTCSEAECSHYQQELAAEGYGEV